MVICRKSCIPSNSFSFLKPPVVNSREALNHLRPLLWNWSETQRKMEMEWDESYPLLPNPFTPLLLADQWFLGIERVSIILRSFPPQKPVCDLLPQFQTPDIGFSPVQKSKDSSWRITRTHLKSDLLSQWRHNVNTTTTHLPLSCQNWSNCAVNHSQGTQFQCSSTEKLNLKSFIRYYKDCRLQVHHHGIKWLLKDAIFSCSSVGFCQDESFTAAVWWFCKVLPSSCAWLYCSQRPNNGQTCWKMSD